MEDDIDIYEDLPSFDTEQCEKYKEEIKEFSQKCNNLQQENAELKLKVAELLESNKSLSVNVSSLLKTAKAEISRKDRMIAELRQQLDNMAFRRNSYANPKKQKAVAKSERHYRYAPIGRPEALPVTSQPSSYQESDDEIEDAVQKYEPEKIASTVFGERLRKKILIQQEVERIQKEEAKLAVSEKKATSVKSDVEKIKETGTANNIVKADVEKIKESGAAINIVKPEPQEVTNSFPVEVALPMKSSARSSNGSSLQSHEEDDRTMCERRGLGNKLLGKRINKDDVHFDQKRRRTEDERYHSEDMRHHNGNVKHDDRFNLESNDSAKRVNHRRRSNNREEFERTRQVHGERAKSNYRSRSRTPDRRYVEKRSDRHRTDKYRAYMDKYEKRRHNGLNRDKDYCDKFSKGAYDLREKVEQRVETKVGGKSAYDDYKNSNLDRDCKRGARESPSSDKSRSNSKGRAESKSVDKRRARRSNSCDRLANAKTSVESSKEREGVKIRSKYPKSNIADRKLHDTETKLKKSSRTSSEKDVTNNQLASSAPLPDGSEKEATNKRLASSILLSDGLFPVSDSDEIPQEPKKERKGARTKSKDYNPTIAVEKDRDSKPKSHTALRTSSENEVTNKELASCVPVAEVLTSKLESGEGSDVQKDLNGECTKPATTTLQNVLSEIDNPGEWISSVLKNDAEVPSISSEILAPDVRSRSFREEKIENIEKFIQNYQDDDNLCCRIATGDSEELYCENKSYNSTSTILDTLSMGFEDVAIGKPLLSEQQLLESLSTPVKKDKPLLSKQQLLETLSTPVNKDNPPLPPLPPPDEKKQPPLPPIPSPDEIKQPPLPTIPPPDKEIRKQSLPPLPSLDEKQQPPPPLPFPDDKIQALPPLPSLEKKQALSPLPPPDEKKQPLPSLPTSDEKMQTVQPLLSTDEKWHTSRPLSFPDRKEQPPPPTEDTENQALPPPPPPDDVKQRLSPSFPSSAEELQPASPPLPDPQKKTDLSPPPPPEEKMKPSLSQQSAPEEEKDLLLLPIPAPEDKTKPLLLPAPSEKQNLPSSQPPAPTDKNIDISVTKEISAGKPEPEKTRTDKVALKQINRRKRIPCIPILSRYSRKKRDLVLTDSAASRCIVKSDYSSDQETNNNANVEIEVPPIFNKELEITSKTTKSSEFDDTTSDKSNNNPNSKTAWPVKLSEAVNSSTYENESRIESEVPNAISERRETENVDSSSGIVHSTLPGAEILNSEKPENDEGESRPKFKSKEEAVSLKIQNKESSSEVEKPICPKPVETRGTRSALKTIAPPGPSGDTYSGLSSRKRPLPKEKENQSKQAAKQCKIMVIARRRRPLNLEDSSTATTLVSSQQYPNCDRSSMNSGVKNNCLNSEKPELTEPAAEPASKGRKRRSTDK